ncbi:MAG: hypothetical protein ACJ72L_16515 [Marmoricola sp.]
MSEPKHAEPSSVTRMIWLLVVPIGCALVPWLAFEVADGNPSGLALLVIGAAPLTGCLAALSFSFVSPVRMWPLVPYVVAAAIFVFLVLAARDATSGGGFAFLPVRIFGLALPPLAILGAVISYAWIPVVEPEPEYEPRARA